jgi:hypothetical protein
MQDKIAQMSEKYTENQVDLSSIRHADSNINLIQAKYGQESAVG